MTSLLVLGGARSGKSRYAQKRIEACGGAMVYIATAEARDDEMAQRIAQHRVDRGLGWQTLEAPINFPRAIRTCVAADAILMDCLTLWVSNVMLAGLSVSVARDGLIAAVETCGAPITLIANDVGLGIVPDNALARRFRDEAGWLNQKLAEVIDEVVLLAAGLPMVLKP
jgi:adenosylcobinamide kinase / adenosylcobinamide-phosphate guanylyltransferase